MSDLVTAAITEVPPADPKDVRALLRAVENLRGTPLPLFLEPIEIIFIESCAQALGNADA